ncbi:MAG: glycosyltransferase family 2 protein [Chloroflexi bacterium]|nr:glycosyltransferase family 2 protein [Chloroflexota bacterium]
MSPPLVSVIIPVHNGAGLIGETLESVYWQTYRDWEIVVVDDGSTDETPEILRRQPCLRVIRTEKRGPAAARNTAIAAARGDLLALLDGDDLWTPDKLETHVAAMLARPECGFATTLHREFVEDGVVLPKEWEGGAPRGEISAVPVPSTWMFTRAAFDRTGPFDETYRWWEDLDWMNRAEARGVQRFLVEEVLLLRRIHGTNVSLDGAAAKPYLFRALRGALARRREGQVPDGPQ